MAAADRSGPGDAQRNSETESMRFGDEVEMSSSRIEYPEQSDEVAIVEKLLAVKNARWAFPLSRENHSTTRSINFRVRVIVCRNSSRSKIR
jgi:hypothetical protein